MESFPLSLDLVYCPDGADHVEERTNARTLWSDEEITPDICPADGWPIHAVGGCCWPNCMRGRAACQGTVRVSRGLRTQSRRTAQIHINDTSQKLRKREDDPAFYASGKRDTHVSSTRVSNSTG